MMSFLDAPRKVRITGFPANFTVVEKASLALNCSAESRPPSIKEWYFDGELINWGELRLPRSKKL